VSQTSHCSDLARSAADIACAGHMQPDRCPAVSELVGVINPERKRDMSTTISAGPSLTPWKGIAALPPAVGVGIRLDGTGASCGEPARSRHKPRRAAVGGHTRTVGVRASLSQRCEHTVAVQGRSL
jgi:hypothetical protein